MVLTRQRRSVLLWTVAEYALLAKMSDVEVAARTGRKVKAVAAWRRLVT